MHYQSLGNPQRILVACSLVATAVYLHWRLGTFNPDAMIFSTILYFAEIYGVISLFMHLFMTEKLVVRTPLEPNPYSTVDIFIPIYNEKIEILRRTAIAAKKMDFPCTVYILDDGNREEVRLLAEKIDCKYLARTTNKHAKAGNLNNGLKHSTGEFIAVFDVDHAPKRTFVSQTLGYFNDEKVAFVQTPQVFYNLDSFQHRGNKETGQVWTEQSMFFNLIQRGKDYWNAAFFCGSCAIIRRSSLERIDGFATGTITEDLHTSIRIHKAGFKSVYHAESLAFGIAPAQMGPFLKQRKRWGMGAMHVWRSEGILFTPGLTIPQRINYFASVITYFDGWQRLIYYLTPGIVLLFGIPPILSTLDEFPVYFLPYFILHLFMMSEISRGYGQVLYMEQYNMTRFHTFCMCTLGWLKLSEKFEVTNKSLIGSRIEALSDLFPQIFIFAFNGIALVYAIAMHYTGDHLSASALWINVIWAACCIGVASSIIKFALRLAKFKRNDYRFQLPLKAEVNCLVDGHMQKRPIYLKNISGSGVMFTVDKYAQFKKDDVITGNLQLPDDLPFTAHVRMVGQDADDSHINIVGCEFEWKDSRAMENLEGFLYGTDLEFRMHGVSERKPTILELIFKDRSVRGKALSSTKTRKLSTANAYQKRRG